MIDRLLFADGFNLNTISSHPLQHTAYLSLLRQRDNSQKKHFTMLIKGFFPVKYIDNLKNEMKLKEKFEIKIRKMRGFLGQF